MLGTGCEISLSLGPSFHKEKWGPIHFFFFFFIQQVLISYLCYTY